MRTVKTEEFEDEDGIKLRETIDDDSGKPKEVILLVQPSQSYKDRVLKPADKAREQTDKEVEHGRKVADKMREMAEKELEKENG